MFDDPLPTQQSVLNTYLYVLDMVLCLTELIDPAFLLAGPRYL